MSTTGPHRALVDGGAAWLAKQGFGVIATELAVSGVREQADVIAFRSSCSAVIEAKTSRGDFVADARKPHRSDGGIGNYRFFICPDAIILPAELPSGWGLIYLVGRRSKVVVAPQGNRWPADPRGVAGEESWRAYWHPSDPAAERRVLYSIARRIGTSSKGRG